MTRDKVIKILGLLKASYPNTFKDYTQEQAEMTISLYQSMFNDDDYELISIALKEIINNSKFIPTIADIKEKMYELTNKETIPIELWNIAKKMIGNGLYMTQEEFDSYPKEIRTFFGGLSGLKQISMMDSKTVNSVIQSNFLKQISIIQERDKQEKKMLPETKQRLAEINNKLLGDGK